MRALFHASLASLQVHLCECGRQDAGAKLHPIRDAARRQRALMAIGLIAAGTGEWRV